MTAADLIRAMAVEAAREIVEAVAAGALTPEEVTR